jgi:hypothetical protein
MTPTFPLNLFAIVFTLCGSQARPGGEALPSALMDMIEAKISASPCIGSLAKWDREYSYKAWMEDGRIYHLDTLAIVFRYAEAGRFEFRSGRHFSVDPPAPMIDDRSYEVAYGEFDLVTKQVTIKSCGLNMPAE